jgi:hypothetical protein
MIEVVWVGRRNDIFLGTWGILDNGIWRTAASLLGLRVGEDYDVVEAELHARRNAYALFFVGMSEDRTRAECVQGVSYRPVASTESSEKMRRSTSL